MNRNITKFFHKNEVSFWKKVNNKANNELKRQVHQ